MITNSDLFFEINGTKKKKSSYKKYSRKAEIRGLLGDCERVALGDVCELEKGKNSSTFFDKQSTGLYPVISKAKHISNWKMIDTYENDGSNVYMSDTFAGDGTGDLTIHYYDGKCSHTNLSNKLVLIKTNIINKYLYYIMTQNIKIFNDQFQKGSSKPTLDKVKLMKYKIPLPSPEIQQQCITIFEQKEQYLNQLDEKINKEKEYIEELKSLGKDIIATFCD